MADGEEALAAVILAAGAGSRMRSELPKVLHPVGGEPMIAHVLALARAAGAARIVVVVGHGGDEVARRLTDLPLKDAPVASAADRAPSGAGAGGARCAPKPAEPEIVWQREQRGTGHAVAMAAPLLADFPGDVLVLYGDTPLIRPETVRAMQDTRKAGHAVVVLGFHADEPGGYGRLVRGADGTLERIVEARDASPEERAIPLCNSGVVLAPARLLFDLLSTLDDDNAAGEIYLTDIVAAARARGKSAAVVLCPEAETLGVNTRADLARAEAAFQARRRRELLEAGVTLVAPETVFLSRDCEVAADALVEPFVVIGPGVRIGPGAHIRSFSHLEGCTIGPGATIGPHARLRPGAHIAAGARVGNFVEIKNAEIGEKAKVNHLSYVGDASVGEAANIGAGTITCNYDGVMKHRTEIGPRAFIGSNTALVAPVSVGAEAMTGSGSVITEDVPEGALAIARARQVTKPGLARRLMARLRALKVARTRQREG